ncbi:hypothetical protein GQ457_02G018290 [Hibiscus cannabinus]
MKRMRQSREIKISNDGEIKIAKVKQRLHIYWLDIPFYKAIGLKEGFLKDLPPTPFAGATLTGHPPLRRRRSSQTSPELVPQHTQLPIPALPSCCCSWIWENTSSSRTEEKPESCNVVACEGVDRVERHETLAQWRTRMETSGFSPVHLGSNAYKLASMLFLTSPRACFSA